MNKSFTELQQLLNKLLDVRGNFSSPKMRTNTNIVHLIESSEVLNEFITFNQKVWAIRNRVTKPPSLSLWK